MMRKNKITPSNKPTPALAELLATLRLVPADYEFPDPEKVLETVFFKHTDNSVGATWLVQTAANELAFHGIAEGAKSSDPGKAFLKTLEIIKNELQENCPLFFEENLSEYFKEPESWEKSIEAWMAYQGFYLLRRDFLLIISRLEEFRSFGFETNERSFHPRIALKEVTTTFDIDRSGRITFMNDVLINALEGVDAKRLRLCVVCRSPFWAYRSNTKFCQKKCADKYHQQQRRDDPKKRAKINKQRQVTYASAKELKNGKQRKEVRKNGTL